MFHCRFMIGNCVLCWNGWSIQWNSASVTLIQNSLSNLWNTLKQTGWLQQVFCLASITSWLKTVLYGFGPWYAKERFPFWRFSEEFFFLNRMSGETAPYQSILCHNISNIFKFYELQKNICVYFPAPKGNRTLEGVLGGILITSASQEVSNWVGILAVRKQIVLLPFYYVWRNIYQNIKSDLVMLKLDSDERKVEIG